MAVRYKPYPEYKDSGVEWLEKIPSHWSACQLKFLSSCNDEVLSESLNSEYEIEYVDIGSVSAIDGIQKTETMLLGRAPSRARRIVRDGDVIVSTVRTYLEAIASIDFPPENLVVSTGFAVIRPGRFLHKRFAAYCLRAKGFIKEVVARSVGISYPAINASDLIDIKVPVPIFKEQGAIANFLDHETAKIDTLIEKQQQLIQLLKEKRQAVISHAVTKGFSSLNSGPSTKLRESGIEWLGEVPEHWGIGKVKNLASVISKGTTPSTMGSDFESTGIRFLKAENIGKEFYVASQPEFYISEKTDEQLSRSRLQSHDVLVIIAGATTGQSSLMQDDLLPANTNQAVSFIRPVSSSYSSYISFWLSTEYAQSKIWQVAVQAAQPNLSMESLGNIYIPIPPEHELDELVTNINFRILQLSRLTESAELAINLMHERRTALISAAVTGKIDVRDWVAPEGTPNDKEVAA